MRRFTELYHELDASNRTTAKLGALKRYFGAVPPRDGAWAVYFLTGNRLPRPVKSREFREWAGEACGFPDWMVDECYHRVGDLAETLALLLGGRANAEAGPSAALPLHRLIEEELIPLRGLEPGERRKRLVRLWEGMDVAGCFVFNKLITGGFRVGVSKTLVHRALAELAEVEPAVMAHRLMGDWRPEAASYRALFVDEGRADDPARPYPFCLAYPLDQAGAADIATTLGDRGQWQVEWKWDGIRAQLIKRGRHVMLWSRGEEMVGESFPEVIDAAARWDRSAVLDGELLAWDAEAKGPAPFARLQRRLGRKTVGPKLRKEAPVVFMAYDLLEADGQDCRPASTRERRARLVEFCQSKAGEILILSPLLGGDDWEAVSKLRAESRARRVEGLMLKRADAPYSAGRRKGEWWKWKIDPYTVDAVLTNARQGHGRRAGLYTDYTFAVWDGDELVPFAKAYSGLRDAEIREVDRWVRRHTFEKHGPVRVVEPELVFEIAFEGIGESKRHKSGIAVRFPRISRWRRDKAKAEADRLETVRALLPRQARGGGDQRSIT